MDKLTDEQRKRIVEKIVICKEQVKQMEEDLALLNTGGLTDAQNNEIGEDDGEPVRARGIGARPVQEMIIHRGITPSYPLQWFQKHGWLKPIVTVPAMRKDSKVDDYYAYIAGSF